MSRPRLLSLLTLSFTQSVPLVCARRNPCAPGGGLGLWRLRWTNGALNLPTPLGSGPGGEEAFTGRRFSFAAPGESGGRLSPRRSPRRVG